MSSKEVPETVVLVVIALMVWTSAEAADLTVARGGSQDGVKSTLSQKLAERRFDPVLFFY